MHEAVIERLVGSRWPTSRRSASTWRSAGESAVTAGTSPWMPSACAARRPSSNAPTGAPPLRRSSRSNGRRSAGFRPNGCRCGIDRARASFSISMAAASSKGRRGHIRPTAWRLARDTGRRVLAACVPEGARSSLSRVGRRRRSGVSLVARPGTRSRPHRRRGRLGGRQHRAGRHTPPAARGLAAAGSAGPLLAMDRPRMRGGELPAQCVSRRDVPGRRHAGVRCVPGARDRPSRSGDLPGARGLRRLPPDADHRGGARDLGRRRPPRGTTSGRGRRTPELHVFRHMPHAFPVLAEALPRARTAFLTSGRFLEETLGRA